MNMFFDIENWLKQNCVSKKVISVNGIDWLLAIMNDTWVAVFEKRNGEYIPIIQAMDEEKAIAYCSMVERLNFPCEKI